MHIEEIKNLKDNLQSEIGHLIANFEANTGVIVAEVSYDSTRKPVGGISKDILVFHQVTVKIEL